MEDPAEHFFNEGVEFGKLGRYPDAPSSFDKAVALKPDYAAAWYNRGNTLRQLIRYVEALSSYDKAIAINPNHSEAKKNREIALQKRDKQPRKLTRK